MDQADEDLRETITQIWPIQAKKMLDLLVPRKDVLNAGKLTVGKIYAGLIIVENWRTTRFKPDENRGQVSHFSSTTTMHRNCFNFSFTWLIT